MNNLDENSEQDEWDFIEAANIDATTPLPPAPASREVPIDGQDAGNVSTYDVDRPPKLTDPLKTTVPVNNTTIPSSDVLDTKCLLTLFPTKDETKRQKWLSTLHENEFETFQDLGSLDSEGWNLLSLPLAVKALLKSEVKRRSSEMKTSLDPPGIDLSADESHDDLRSVTQVDCIVMDISSSMRARSHVDVDKTREDGKQ